MRELSAHEVHQVNGAIWANVGGAAVGAMGAGYGYFAGSSNPSIGGALAAIGGGAVAGAFSPITTIGGAAAVAFGSFGGSWVSSGGFDQLR